jgi:carboxypeptidase PM20D1
MRIGAGVAIAIGALLIGAAGVVSIRTVSGSRQISASPIAAVAVDASAAAERLAGAVRFETISFDDKPDASADAFLGLHEYLARQFPLVHRTLKLEKVGQYSLLYTWPGSDPSLKPIMLMAHQDVVPIAPGTEKDWLHKPFSGPSPQGIPAATSLLGDRHHDQQKDREIERVERPTQPSRDPRLPLLLAWLLPPGNFRRGIKRD